MFRSTMIACGLLPVVLLAGCKALNTSIAPIDNSSRVNNYYYYYGDGNTTTTNNGEHYPLPNKSLVTSKALGASQLTDATIDDARAAAQLTGIALQLAQNSQGMIHPGTGDPFLALPLAQGSFANFRWRSNPGQRRPQPLIASGNDTCGNGGAIIYGDAFRDDPGSPFTAGDFSLQSADYDQCQRSVTTPVIALHATYSGNTVAGCPVSDAACSRIGYIGLGVPDALFGSELSSDDGSSTQNATTYQLSRMDIQYDAQGAGLAILQEQTGDVRYQGSGQPSRSAHYDAMLGKHSQPFTVLMSQDGSQFGVSGPFAFTSPDLDRCASGAASITTTQPISVGSGGQLTSGSLRLNSAGQQADVHIDSDGSWQVTIDGQTTTLDGNALTAAAADCGL